MSTIPFRCMVDASVGSKLFVEESLSEREQGLLDSLTFDPPAELHVPDLFFIECANILWKYTQRFGRPIEESLADLSDLERLALQVTSTADLMEEALSLAVKTGLTAYDACYAVLANRLNLPLVTADRQLCEAIEWAIWLGDLIPSS